MMLQPLTHLSLLGQISGELGLDDISDLTSWEWKHVSPIFWSLLRKVKENESINPRVPRKTFRVTQSWHRTQSTQDLKPNRTNLRVCLSDGVSVLEWRRGKRPERRFTGLFRGDLADRTGG